LLVLYSSKYSTLSIRDIPLKIKKKFIITDDSNSNDSRIII